MDIYLLTIGHFENVNNCEYTPIIGGEAFTTKKEAFRKYAQVKKTIKNGYFVELERVTLTDTATEILKENLKNANYQQRQTALLSAFDDCYQYNSVKYFER